MDTQEKTEQMVREIAGFMANSQAGLDEVLEEYCHGMSVKQIDEIEDLYHKMRISGKLATIKGVQ